MKIHSGCDKEATSKDIMLYLGKIFGIVFVVFFLTNGGAVIKAFSHESSCSGNISRATSAMNNGDGDTVVKEYHNFTADNCR